MYLSNVHNKNSKWNSEKIKKAVKTLKKKKNRRAVETNKNFRKLWEDYETSRVEEWTKTSTEKDHAGLPKILKDKVLCQSSAQN